MKFSANKKVSIRRVYELTSRLVLAIEDFEKAVGKNFDVVYFQNNANRFGHLWQEPTLVATLYNAFPKNILIILTGLPFSEFCIRIHEDVGFEYADATIFEGTIELSQLAAYARVSEMKVGGRTLVFELFDHFYNSTVGISRGHRKLFKTTLKPFKANVFNRLKIQGDKRIAVLHVRESGWVGAGYNDYRDANISNYIKAIKLLESRGFQIVRIGDRSMTPMSYLSNNVLDLAVSTHFEDGDDVVITAFCDIYLGQTSGPMILPYLFGKDLIITNEPNPYIGRFQLEDDFRSITVTLFKHHIYKGRFLSLSDFLRRPARYSSGDFKVAGIKLVENSPEEIENSVAELLARRAGAWDTSLDSSVHRWLDALWAARQLAGLKGSNIGRPLLNCYISHVHLPLRYGGVESNVEHDYVITSDVNDISSALRWMLHRLRILCLRLVSIIQRRGIGGTLGRAAEIFLHYFKRRI